LSGASAASPSDSTVAVTVIVVKTRDPYATRHLDKHLGGEPLLLLLLLQLGGAAHGLAAERATRRRLLFFTAL
jgi:hypothetical protein